MRLLLTSSIFLDNQKKQNELEIWVKLISKLASPAMDFYFIDNCSPIDPAPLVKTLTEKFHWFSYSRYTKDIGHPRAAWRAFSDAATLAVDAEYDYWVWLETDFILCRDPYEIVRKVDRAGVQLATPFDMNAFFPETQFMIASTRFLRKSRYVARWDWRNRDYKKQPILHEIWVEREFNDDLFYLTLRGIRNDFGLLTVDSFPRLFPNGCDYLSHCDIPLYLALLKKNGITL